MESQQFDLAHKIQEAARQATLAEHQISLIPRRLPEEVAAELEAKKLEAAHQRYKELVLLNATIATLVLLILFCLIVAATKGLGSDEGKLAFGALTTIIGTLLGYFTGKSSK